MIFLLTLVACIFVLAFVFVLKHTGYLVIALKSGLMCVLLLVVGSFIFGLFFDFRFLHASSSAGLDAAKIYATLFGVYLGPFIFFIGGIGGALISYCLKKSKQRQSEL